MTDRILFVAANPSVDRLYEVARLAAGAIHRPELVVAVPGGKGLNAARAAASLGGRVTVVGIVGGRSGDWIRDEIDARGIQARWASSAALTRTCVSILDRSTGEMTEIYERGEPIEATAWEELERAVTAALSAGDVAAVALSGSLPPGAPQDGFGRIAAMAGSVPVLADTYGLLFNRAMFSAAGIDEPPRTFDELTELAKRLTVRNPDGSLRVVGFDPTIGFYENRLGAFGQQFGASWRTDGRSCVATDPAWTRFLTWQRDLVDWYGAADLAAFHDRIGDEFATDNAFQAGRLAMCLDGEWRVAFIAVEADELDYGTAPLPVDDLHPELYGSGYINGSVIAIPLRARHREAAWTLVRYLATDEAALAKLSNGLRNVPSTRASLRSPVLVPDERFAVFLDIFAHERSASAPMTPIGSDYQTMFEDLGRAWQDGQIADLGAALRGLDAAIDGRIETTASSALASRTGATVEDDRAT